MSLADITKIARVEPITLISSGLVGNKDLYSILHGVLNIYAGYYLQAVHILSTQIYDSRILKILDKTNPDRDLKTFLTAGQLVYESMPTDPVAIKTMSLENAKYMLPMIKTNKKLTLESMGLDTPGGDDAFGYSSDYDKQQSGLNTAIPKIESFDKLGMTVGKVINVTFCTTPGGSRDSKGKADKSNQATVPVIVKLDTMITDSSVITAIATANADEITFGSRFRDAINGRIGFIKDFMLCSDLIKAQRKTMIKDVNGFYSQLLKRVNNSKVYSALSGNISMSGISAIYVLSEQDEADIQRKVGGKLTNKTTRDIVFDNTSAMMLVVIDNEWERVSIYVRDIDGFSQNSFDSFKNSTDSNNDKMMQVMKAFSMASPQTSF